MVGTYHELKGHIYLSTVHCVIEGTGAEMGADTDIKFLISRVQVTLLLETTREIVNVLDANGVRNVQIAIALIAVVLSCLHVEHDPIMLSIVQLLAALLASLASTQVADFFGDAKSLWDIGLFTLFSLALIVAVTTTIPLSVSGKTIVSRLQFALMYATAERIRDVMRKSRLLTWVVIVLTALGLSLTQNEAASAALERVPMLGIVVATAYLTTLEMAALVLTMTTGVGVLNVIYSLSVSLVVAFLLFGLKTNDWQLLALWRIADVVIMDVQRSYQFNEITLVIIMTAFYEMVLVARRRIHMDDVAGDVYVLLARLVSVTTATRTIVALASGFPTAELLAIRVFLIFVVLQ
eukprot:3496259-Rhodomonas_salina.2